MEMEAELAKMAASLAAEQKESLRILWTMGTSIISVLITVVGVLFGLLLSELKDRHKNEKETIRILAEFSSNKANLNDSVKETNVIISSIYDKINNPIIPNLSQILKENKK